MNPSPYQAIRQPRCLTLRRNRLLLVLEWVLLSLGIFLAGGAAHAASPLETWRNPVCQTRAL
ncbi:MAG: hypothetical protein FD135_5258, partial [Comamonadaceae bacterium]